MISCKTLSFGRPAGWWAALLLSIAFATEIQAANLKLDLRLIWGTDEEPSPDSKHKPVDDATVEKMRKIFKWKKYYEINHQVGMVPSRGTRQFEMSKKCVIEITELEGPKVEVKLIGDGKPVNKTTYHLAKGESFTIAGDDKNSCAWFVLITDLDENR